MVADHKWRQRALAMTRFSIIRLAEPHWQTWGITENRVSHRGRAGVIAFMEKENWWQAAIGVPYMNRKSRRTPVIWCDLYGNRTQSASGYCCWVSLDEQHLKRVYDYVKELEYTIYKSWEEFTQQNPSDSLLLLYDDMAKSTFKWSTKCEGYDIYFILG